MSALAEIIAALVAFLVEVTVNAAIFIVHLFLAIFSRKYRGKLRADWDKSAWERFWMVAGLLVYGGSAVVALLIWTGILFAGSGEDVAVKEKEPGLEIRFHTEDGAEIRVSGSLDKALEKIKKIKEERAGEKGAPDE